MKAGDVLRDKYELVSSIGRGGMGEVFHARHLETEANVAIKVVSRAFIGDVLMARLEREAAAAARIQSPFIPRMLEVDRTDEGELFLVMELLHGESLSERLKRSGGMLPWDEARLIGDNVLQALIAAHAAGVVHRDLKPGNIFIETMHTDLGSERQVPTRARILDFGVCKLDGLVEGEKLTVTGESVGTIAYMAPEQIRGASRVDERADLYSFAMVVFEMLSGRLAYDAAGQMALLASKLERHARSLSSTVQVPVPTHLDPLINKALSREPADRQANAREVLHAWRSLGPAQNNVTGLPIVTHSGLTINPLQTVLTSGAAPPNGGKASRSSVIVAVAAIVASLVVGVTALRHRGASTEVVNGNVMDNPTDLTSTADSSGQTPQDVPASGTGGATGENATGPAKAQGQEAAGAEPGSLVPAFPQQTGVIFGDGLREVVAVPPSTPAPVAMDGEVQPDRSSPAAGKRAHVRPPERPHKPGPGTSGPAIIEQPHY